MVLALAVVAFCVGLSTSTDEEWIQTPHGLRPRECVLRHNESNVVIDKVEGGLLIRYPDISNESTFHPTSQKCLDNARLIMSQYKAKLTSDDSAPNNGGWEIFSHYGQANLGRFDSEYIVPTEQMPISGQLLYYFVGLTNFDANETIIQPVLAYCGSSSCGFSYEWSGWQMAAWNCCPNGLTNYGKGVQLKGGDSIKTVTLSNPSTGNIQVYMSAPGGVSSLNENGDYRRFNDAEICGEFYSYSNCDQFNSVPVQFNSMAIYDTSGRKVDVPPSKWTVTNNNPLGCGGSLDIESSTTAKLKARS